MYVVHVHVIVFYMSLEKAKKDFENLYKVN